jgi:hypothetical protein
MSPNVQLNNHEIEEVTQGLLGRFFIAFARLELNLSLQVGGAGTFQDKLERYYEVAISQFGDSDVHFCEISAWYMEADSLRNLRNRFAHGRWGFHAQEQIVVHVSGYPPDLQDERHFSLSELDSIVKDAESLGNKRFKLVR